MLRRLLTLLLLLSAGCSLLIEEGQLAAESDADFIQEVDALLDGSSEIVDAMVVDSMLESDMGVDVNPDDQGAPPDSSMDSSLALDEGTIVDLGTIDAAAGPDALVEPDGLVEPDAAAMPCFEVECPLGQACTDGECEPAFCPENCEEDPGNVLCAAECCSGQREGERGSCADPIEIRLGRARGQQGFDSDESNLAASCGGEEGTEVVYEFIAPESETVCVSDQDPQADLILYVLANCCETSELACAGSHGPRNNSQLSFDVEQGQSYLIVADLAQPELFNRSLIAVRVGLCPCEGEAECPVLHTCDGGRCLDRAGASCVGDDTCGRDGVCRPSEGRAERTCVPEN